MLLKYEIDVAAGRYPIEWRMTHDDRDYALIPAKYLDKRKGWVNPHTFGDGFGQGCKWMVSYFVPVDMVTGTPTERAYSMSKRIGPCGDTASPFEFEKTAELSGANAVSFNSFASEQEFAAHVHLQQQKELQVQRANYEIRFAANDAKRNIGARICKGIVVRFTERVSADTGKIQIRIAAGAKETITWEDPTYWDLCEAGG
jgi:hypothetical protein